MVKQIISQELPLLRADTLPGENVSSIYNFFMDLSKILRPLTWKFETPPIPPRCRPPPWQKNNFFMMKLSQTE